MLLALLIVGATVIVLATVLGPLMKPAKPPPARSSFDRAIYRDQLQELEREVARGLVEPGQAASARLELQRRLLAADAAPTSVRAGARQPIFAAVTAMLIALAAGAIYLRVGAPELPAEPYAARGAERAQAAAEQAQMKQIKGMVAKLAARLKASPDDVDGWLRLGRSYAVLGEHDKADAAFAQAERLKPNDLSVLLPEADAMMIGHSPTAPLSDRVVALLQRIIALDPAQPAALWYLGLHAAEQRDFAKARTEWQKLLAALPADSKERHTVEAAIKAIKGK